MTYHARTYSYETQEGDLRVVCQVVLGPLEIYHIGTFESLQRAKIAGRIFIYWAKKYPNANFHALRVNRTRDAI